MNIGSIVSHQSVSFYSKKTNVQSESTNKSVFIVDETVENVQNSSSIKKDSSNLYKELSSRYDIRNATFEEVLEISSALYEAGEITSTEHGLMIFDYERATNYLKRNAPGVSSSFNMYETPADSNGRRDWIAEFGARASKSLKYGNLIGHQSNQKVLDIFEKLLR
ncbi:hypothetical protein [Sporosarcina limicola]|uniref:Uncharacterized protein n=1 Tax=Sporosarcina limicola TaxID=34101 RepID=A0A927MNI0_9BACL|nr:hypothetical protein [Sporosarcina limicola]MBE1554694.1 hypothetical protein [Sporosarcina limicola]